MAERIRLEELKGNIINIKATIKLFVKYIIHKMYIMHEMYIMHKMYINIY